MTSLRTSAWEAREYTNTGWNIIHSRSGYVINALVTSSYLGICDEVANCPAPSWLDSSVRRALNRYHRGDGFESLLRRQFFRLHFCEILVITVVEIHIVYDDNVGAGQCTIKVQEPSKVFLTEFQKGGFSRSFSFFGIE